MHCFLGPATILWGFITVFAMSTVVSYSMAEICSAYPSAGSVYHWSAQLVPAEYAPLASYICGWFNFVGNAAGDASFAYFFAQFLNSAIAVSGGNVYYDDQTDNEDNTVGVSIAVILVWSLLNIFRVDQVGWINNLAAFCHAGGIIVIIIALLSIPEHLNSSEFVFTKYVNETGFENKSYVVVIGLLTGMYSFAGYEASAHMAEETGSATTAAPKGIINTVLATGVGGIAYALALLYSTTDIQAAVTGPTSEAATNVFISSCGSQWGQALTWIVLINLFFAGISSVAITGRITFSLMRDNAFPYGEYFSQVHPTFKSPVYSIFFVFVIDCFLQLLPLIPKNGDTAFESIVGLSTIGFQVSYGIPILLKLVYQPADFPDTPMSLGAYSRPIGIVSCLWLFGSSFFFFLPTLYPVTNSNMNWLTVVMAGVFLLCSLNWVYNSRFTFKGPRRADGSGSFDVHDKLEDQGAVGGRQHNPLVSLSR
jgi:amino acid transporter